MIKAILHLPTGKYVCYGEDTIITNMYSVMNSLPTWMPEESDIPAEEFFTEWYSSCFGISDDAWDADDVVPTWTKLCYAVENNLLELVEVNNG